ncbi:MAG: phenylpyruvate tautomerase MIF-related protein [Methylophagaceae bacterium]
MPYLNIVTNQTINDESSLLKAASHTVAKAAAKPESYVMIAIETKASMLMGGSDAPTAILDYRALGLPADRTAFSDALCTLITEQLGIAGDRIYISMTDSERQNWGWNHSTF